MSIPCLLNGGTEQQTMNLARTLVQLGQDVRLIVYFEYDHAMAKQLKASGIEVQCLNWVRSLPSWRFVRKLRALLEQENPSIVHIQYMAPGALPIIAAKLAGVTRIFATVHQPWTPSHGLRNKFILRVVARLCDRFTVVSETAERSWFGSSHLIEHDSPISEQPRHFTLHNAVDVSRLTDIAKQFEDKPDWSSLGIPPQAVVIGAVSRLRHEKGIDLLLEAFASIKSHDHKPVYLILVGDGPDRPSLEHRAKALGVTDRVIFVGSVDWLTAMWYLAQMDIVVVPSRFEGFGLTAAEAMAMGKPVVVSDAHGLTEIVQDQQNGLVFEAENWGKLAEHISTLISNPELSYQLGERAKQTVAQKFDIPMFKKNVATLYGLR